MLIDELKEQLKPIESNIETIKTYWESAKLENLFQELENQVN